MSQRRERAFDPNSSSRFTSMLTTIATPRASVRRAAGRKSRRDRIPRIPGPGRTEHANRSLHPRRAASAPASTTTRRSDSRRFVCYRSALRGTGSRTVRVRDEVRGAETGAASSPYRGCAAAGKRLPSESSPAYLVCSPLTSATPGGSIVLRNLYGYVKGVLGPRATICAEATRAI